MAAVKTEREQAVRLDSKRILVVEDEFYIADDLRKALIGAGAEVIGPIASFNQAQQAVATEHFDCAILDLNLRGESAVPIAEHLLELNIPFTIATGYGSSAVPDELAHVRRVEKPFDPAVILEIVGALSSGAA
jgi:DNA-binding NtrC family response regulator